MGCVEKYKKSSEANTMKEMEYGGEEGDAIIWL